MSNDLRLSVQNEEAGASLSMADVDITARANNGSRNRNLALTAAKMKYGGLIPQATFIVCAVLGAFSVLSMLVAPSVVIYVAMGTGVVVSSFATAQRFQLLQMEGLREIHNEIRMEVNRLQNENDELSTNVEDLESQSARVLEQEGKLNDIVEKQGGNVQSLMSCVKENKEILEEMKAHIKLDTVQDIISTIMLSDRDGDFQIDPEEVDILVLRLSNSSGINFNEQKFRAMFEDKGFRRNTLLVLCSKILEMSDENNAEESLESADRFIDINPRGLQQ